LMLEVRWVVAIIDQVRAARSVQQVAENWKSSQVE
jgi:hypothetical protein